VASVEHPVASTLPLSRLGLGVGKLLWRRRTSCPEPVGPTPSYSAVRQGPTSLLTGWASPIRMRVKGPMGGGEINLTFPLDLTIYFFNFFSRSITNQCIEHVLSSRSISILSIPDRLNSYKFFSLSPFIVRNLKLLPPS
jgi:hypothetical protein